MSRLAPNVLAVLLAASAVCSAESGGSDVAEDRPLVGARLAWVSADGIDLVGDAFADVPFLGWGDLDTRSRLFFALDVRTTIEETSNNFDFILRDLDYGAHLGWRTTPRRGPLGAVGVLAGQRGKARVDVAGDRWIRYVALELQSRHFRQIQHPSWFEWTFAAGPVLDERDVDADAWVAGALRFDGPRGRTSGSRGARFGFDVQLNGIWQDGAFEADVAVGPRVVLPTGSGQSAVLFARYQWSDNPLGLGVDAWLVGLEYVEDETAAESPTVGADIYGWLSAGVGKDERVAGTLDLRALTPQFASHYRGVGTLQINALGGGSPNEADELFYRYDVGIQRVWDSGFAGVYFYHRSNHLIAEDGPGITSINVAEIGWETPLAYRIGIRDLERRWGLLDYRLRVGFLIDSAFGEDDRWHARGGLRWTMPLGPAASQLYARFAFEAGDVGTWSAGLGLATGSRVEIELERREDRQYFGDPGATLLNARYAF